MILIDAIYIHETGGRVLLNYFVSKLEERDIVVTYLFDNRIPKNFYKIKRTNDAIYLKSSLYQRLKFYQQNRGKFQNVFCFGNVPPPIKLSSVVYTFLHQAIYLEIPKKIPLKDRLVYFVKTQVIKKWKKHSDYWIVQNNRMKVALQTKMNLKNSSILIVPFYPSISSNLVRYRDECSFLYVSGYFQHKNHRILIDAFCTFYNKHKTGKLTLTIDKSASFLYQYIKKKIGEGYPIVNVGFVSRDKLVELYKTNEYLVFPSLAESFGLGIIEAIENECNIIAADLPYVYEVCQPSLVFDPYGEESIVEALENSLYNTNIKKSLSKSSDQIEYMLDLLVCNNHNIY